MKQPQNSLPASFKRSSTTMVKKNLPQQVINANDLSQVEESEPQDSPKANELKDSTTLQTDNSTTLRTSDSSKLDSSSHSSSHSKPIHAAKRPNPSSQSSTDDEFETKKPKFNYYAHLQKLNAPARNPEAFSVPKGQENCLEGLTFVLTGDLQALGREEAKDFIKRLGGRVTTMPSSKTSYVVVGQDAGPSKMTKIKELKLKTLDEGAFYDFVAKAPAKPFSSPKATVQEQPKPKAPIEIPFALPSTVKTAAEEEVVPLVQKYAPHSIGQVIGNGANISRLISWLRDWNPKAKASKDCMKAALLSGPPGIGKTTTALLACKSLGLIPVEFNASDSRSKSSLEDNVKALIQNKGCDQYFCTNFFPNPKNKVNHVLVMDEVDGMSSGDRGGMAQLIGLIKATKIPIICICNDRNSSKVRSLSAHCLDLRFRKLESRHLAEKMGEIAKKEGLIIQPNAMEQIVSSCQSDIRQILNVLTWMKLGQCNDKSKPANAFDFDAAKHLNSQAKKDTDQGIFDVISDLFSGFSRTSLPEKLNAYFVDSGLIPLMVQENYLLANPMRGEEDGLQAAFQASDSFSTSDLVDSIIQRKQEYSLTPFHALLTCAIPTFFHGNGMKGKIEFASWLGQNSKQTKNFRLLRQINMHIFLAASLNKTQLRLYQLPEMCTKILDLLKSFEKTKSNQIDKAIEFLDDYALLKDDFDEMLEICIEPYHSDDAFSKISSNVKRAFTQQYNKMTHHLPYAITAAVSASTATVKRSKEEGNEGESGEEEENLQDDDALENDKMIKQKIAKAPRKKAAK